jgi:uncharacterized membrane protein
MTARQLGIIRAIIAFVLSIIAVWSIAIENSIPLFIAVVLAVVVLMLSRRATTEVLQDERTVMLYARSSRAAMSIVLPVAALAAIAVIIMREHLPHDVVTAAYTVSYSVSALMIVQAAFFYYYGRKH